MGDGTEDFFDAVRDDDVAAVTAALDADAELLTAYSAQGFRPLLEAVLAGADEVVGLLLDRGAPVDAGEAAALGREDALRKALDETPSALDAQGQGGWTPLHLAAYAGQVETTRLLLERGARPGVLANNRQRNSALHAAVAGAGKLEVVRLLIEAGARPGARASLRVTPLHLAASRGNLGAVELLLEAGAEPQPMEDGRTPAELARERGFPEVAARLEG